MKNKLFHFVLICLLLSLPFERLLTFEVAGFTLKVSYLFASILILSTVFFSLKVRRVRLDLIEKVAGLFVLFSLASNIWSIDHRRTLIISLLYLFVFALMYVIKRFSDNKKQSVYLNILLWIGFALSIFAIWQFFSNSFNVLDRFSFLRDEYKKGVFPFPRVQSTFLEPLFFANFLVIPFFLSIKKFYDSQKSRLSYLILFVISIAFTLTVSRGAYLALIGALVVFTIYFIFALKQKAKMIMPVLITIALASVVSFVLIYVSTGQSGLKSYVNQATNTSDVADANTVSRLDYLRTRNYTTQVALSHAKQNLLGMGTGAFGSLPEFKLLKEQGRYQTVNNEYFEVLVENGAVGLVIFLLFIILLLVRLSRQVVASKDLTCLIFLSVMIAWLVQYFTFSNLYLVYIWVFIGLMLTERNKKKLS